MPLAIGPMGQEGNATGGDYVQKSAAKIVGELTGILDTQKLLFEELLDNLADTVTELKETQGDNLQKIDGQDFLDIFADVEDILTGGETEEE